MYNYSLIFLNWLIMRELNRFSPGQPKKLPIVHSERDQFLAYLELLAVCYEDSSILPVLADIHKLPDDADYMTQKYLEVVTPLLLEVKGEVIFPLIPLFDSGMIALNYRKYYVNC